MNYGPTWITPSGFLFTATEQVAVESSVIASGTNVVYKIISGNLPQGLSVSTTGTIYGIPRSVVNLTPNNFVLRASSSQGVSDRSFRIDVVGQTNPVWNTSSGWTSSLDYNTSTAYLKLGPSGEKFTLNKQYVSYQFEATANLSPQNTKLQYFIPEGGGKLPPNLVLERDGQLHGFMNDNLVFDGSESDTGGYDEESYDGYSYDHGETGLDPIGVPKIYQFKVTASDGVSSSDRYFKILVVAPEMIRSPDQIQMTLEPGLIQTNTNYLPPVQFISGNDLGVIRSENNQIINVSAYDAYPNIGSVYYTATNGISIYEQIPNYLSLDQKTGFLHGYVPYQPAYETHYSITINGTKVLSTASVISINTFTLAIRGEVESTIEWISSSTLGTLVTGETSELSIVAQQINSEYNIKYSLVSGLLPPGIELKRDGSLSGKVEYGNTGTFNFTVKAQDVYELSEITRNFNLNVTEYNDKLYTQIILKPFLKLEKRSTFRDFATDDFVFPPKSIYRHFDPYFGIQTEIKMILEFGIEQLPLRDYTYALLENFYKRRLYFGEIKLAIGKNSQGQTLYEVIYVDIVDNMIDNQKQSVSPVLYTNKDLYYPSSITNMQNRLQKIVLDDFSIIGVNEYNRPLFMRTAQQGDYRPAGYMSAVILCYALPGEGAKIKNRIKLKNFDFKQFDFEIDRLIVEKSSDNNTAKYLLFPRKSISDSIPEDKYLFGPEQIKLDKDTDIPLLRE